MQAALLKEIVLRKDYLINEPVRTIYFGGGSPSIMESAEITSLLTSIRENYLVDPDAEITLEANPDDINETKLLDWKSAGVNRLSIGVQSFFEEDLQWMNRAHNAQQAMDSLRLALFYFNNISIDLIYGTPALTDEKWKFNVETAVSLNIPHLSCYALTVEPQTPLHKMIRENRSADVDPDKQSSQFLLLMDWLEKSGYDHYEISNFALPGMRSRHNSSYWQGKPYLGLGPSAHSFNGTSRQWNIANNNNYIESIGNNIIPFEIEELTEIQKTNEYIMTSLRTIEGLDLEKLDEKISLDLLSRSQKYISNQLMIIQDQNLVLTRNGKLVADGIASDLFLDALP